MEDDSGPTTTEWIRALGVVLAVLVGVVLLIFLLLTTVGHCSPNVPC